MRPVVRAPPLPVAPEAPPDISRAPFARSIILLLYEYVPRLRPRMSKSIDRGCSTGLVFTAKPATSTTRTGGVSDNRRSKISESQQDESSGKSPIPSGIERSLQRAATYASHSSSSHSASRQRRPSDCSTSSCTSSSAETIRRTSDESVSLGQIPSCSYRIADVPRDPATVRKMNMLRSLGVGGIRSSADNFPRTAVPVCFDSSNGDMGTIVKGASRPQITDIQPLVEPLKYKEDEPTLLSSSALKLLNPIRRLSLASTCSTSASSIPSTGSNDGNSAPPKSTKHANNKKVHQICSLGVCRPNSHEN